jgi:hypothetical protein
MVSYPVCTDELHFNTLPVLVHVLSAPVGLMVLIDVYGTITDQSSGSVTFCDPRIRNTDNGSGSDSCFQWLSRYHKSYIFLTFLLLLVDQCNCIWHCVIQVFLKQIPSNPLSHPSSSNPFPSDLKSLPGTSLVSWSVCLLLYCENQ